MAIVSLKPSYLAVVPAYNEAATVSGVIESIRESVPWFDVLVVDALRHAPHPTHFSLREALELIGQVRPRRAVLTNLHTDLDYDKLARSLPSGIEPAFDGMRLVV